MHVSTDQRTEPVIIAELPVRDYSASSPLKGQASCLSLRIPIFVGPNSVLISDM